MTTSGKRQRRVCRSRSMLRLVSVEMCRRVVKGGADRGAAANVSKVLFCLVIARRALLRLLPRFLADKLLQVRVG